jgi:hypothetical protein
MRFLIVFAFVLGCAVPTLTEAQERAWFFGSGLTQVSITNGGRDWRPDWKLSNPVPTTSQPIVVRGGRYIVWGAYRSIFSFEQSALVRFDTRTRGFALVPGLSPGAAVTLAIDRRNGLLVVLDSANALHVVDVDKLRVLRTIPLTAPAAAALERTLAVAEGRAFVGWTYWTGPTTQGAETQVIDLDSGQVLLTIPDVGRVARCPDALRVYLQRSFWDDGGAYVTQVDIWDARTVTHVGTAVLDSPVSAVGGLVVSASSAPGFAIHVRAYDADSLTPFFEALAPVPRFSAFTLFELLEPTPAAPIIVRTQSRDVYTWERWTSIRVFNRATLSFVRELWQAPFDEPDSRLVMLAPPVAPRGLTANVKGRSVFLQWNSADDIGDYEVSAGFSPGSRSIGAYRTGGVPFLQVDGVPPGIYYVRVRAINELGSAESADLRVVVP